MPADTRIVLAIRFTTSAPTSLPLAMIGNAEGSGRTGGGSPQRQRQDDAGEELAFRADVPDPRPEGHGGRQPREDQGGALTSVPVTARRLPNAPLNNEATPSAASDPDPISMVRESP